MVEAVRSGSIFASGKEGNRAYDRWRARRRRGKESRGLVGAALETAVLGLAARHPEYVVFDTAAAGA